MSIDDHEVEKINLSRPAMLARLKEIAKKSPNKQVILNGET